MCLFVPPLSTAHIDLTDQWRYTLEGKEAVSYRHSFKAFGLTLIILAISVQLFGRCNALNFSISSFCFPLSNISRIMLFLCKVILNYP